MCLPKSVRIEQLAAIGEDKFYALREQSDEISVNECIVSKLAVQKCAFLFAQVFNRMGAVIEK